NGSLPDGRLDRDVTRPGIPCPPPGPVLHAAEAAFGCSRIRRYLTPRLTCYTIWIRRLEARGGFRRPVFPYPVQDFGCHLIERKHLIGKSRLGHKPRHSPDN